MTELLYLQDAYLQTFEASITSLDPHNRSIILDQTAFYPGGGGQPADSGTLTIDGQLYTVAKAQKEGGAIGHILAPSETWPQLGGIVIGQLDWERRYAAMRTHTAMHILCGVIWRDYGASVTGGNMEHLGGRMDFEFEQLTQDTIGEIEAKINAEVAAARDVRAQILPREEALQIPDLIRTKVNLLPVEVQTLRTVEIVGLDLQADGGTHVRNTSEVGRISITKYKSKGGANKRLYIELH